MFQLQLANNMPSGVYPRTKEMKIGKNPNSRNGFRLGNSGYWKGKRFTKEHKENLRKSLRGKLATEGSFQKGKNHINWQGGISPYPMDWTDDLKEVIRKRDNYICQLCGVHQDELDRKLDIHHIDYDKNNLNPENLVSLCRKCHNKTNFNRDYWINYFQSEII